MGAELHTFAFGLLFSKQSILPAPCLNEIVFATGVLWSVSPFVLVAGIRHVA